MSDFKGKLFKTLGMLLGAFVSWPTVSTHLGTLPDFTQIEKLGVGCGFIIGCLLFTTQIVQKLAFPLRNGWKWLVFIVAIAGWFYLIWMLAMAYETALKAPELDDDRLQCAKFAVFSLAFLWSVPLTYVGGIVGGLFSPPSSSP